MLWAPILRPPGIAAADFPNDFRRQPSLLPVPLVMG